MVSLRIGLLGGFYLRLASGADVALLTRKSRLLLAYLALAAGRAQPRAKLMGLLWSDRAEPQARASLRQELHALRLGLAGVDPSVLRIEGDAVALDAGAVVVDAVEFERLARRGERDALQRAVALYRGDLLEGMKVADAAFEQWLSLERGRFRDLAVAAFGRLLALDMEQGTPEAAAATARRLLAMDQVHEGAHRALMRLLARHGERNAALRQYQLCRGVLARELGVEPEEETEQLHRELTLARSQPERAAQPPARVDATRRSSGSPVPEAEPLLHAVAPSTARETAIGRNDSAGPAGRETERRQVTVVSVDLVGSTELATRLDPEELREVLGAYQRAVAGAVARFDGQVAQLLGDGALACFGWPRAHEDDAERAVRAGLAAVRAVFALRVSCAGALTCRVGIATGLVVAGDLATGGDGVGIVGEAPHLATRLQASAEPGTVVVAESTRRLLGELFALECMGPRSLKGYAAPVQAWRVTGEGTAAGRFEALRGAGLTPLVGRRQELALLLDRWDQAKEGEGQVVLLSGEAGIGKSRLARALRERLGGEPHTPLTLSCSPHHANTALYPVTRLLERAAGLDRADPPDRQLDNLEAMLARATEEVREAARLLADLFSIPATGRYPHLELSPQRKKERTFEVLLDQLAGLAAREPVLALYDDVHWADPTTLELLHHVVERAQRLRTLVVVASRPGFAPPWAGHGHVTALSLARLGRKDAAAMVREVAGGEAVPAEVLDRIVARADGVPLFVEELTRAVLASGALGDRGAGDEADSSAVPATLRDSLMARLDRPSMVKQVAQIGAVIGRVFSRELLTGVAAILEDDLQRGLEQLVGAGLLHRTVDSGREAYSFKHALVREAAYESLLRSRRRELHARVAETLEQAIPSLAADEPELLAHHYTEAGLAVPAIDQWRRAGERAVQRYANVEAIAHLRQALRLVATVPAGPERDRTELALQLGLGVPLIASKGYSAPEVRQAYARAGELCRDLDDPPVLLPVLLGLCVFHVVRADLPKARSLAARCLAAARQAEDHDRRLAACGVAGTAELYLGKLVAARALLERGLALYRPGCHRDHAARYGHNPLATLGFVARAHALLGRTDLARQRSEALLALIGGPAVQPNSLAAMHAHLAHLQLVLRDGRAALQHAQAVVAVALQHDLPLWLGLGRMYRGGALVEEGRSGGDPSRVAEGVADGLEGLAAYRATGARLDVPTCLCWLAAGEARLGRPEAGLRLLDEAQEVIADTGEAYFAAEVHRVAGELNLAPERPDPDAAEVSLRASLSIARRQRAKLLELRAGVSLARLWCHEGQGVRSRDLLAGLCGSFSSGATGQDLAEARTLLAAA